MTADVVTLVPTGGQADDTIRRTIKAIAEGKGIAPSDVADAAGMSRSTYFRKMSAQGETNAFKAGEVARIAAFLEVKVGQLYDGLGGMFVPPPDGGSSMDTRRYAYYSAA